ncbi:hypothetical protein XENOCAPTIV_020336 [Xenoophorus captivus]|uniref:Uncharacterized protein n=2 Tax=Goodeidae TaxID=28758 RepID=A0ABV0RIL6_9TELE
MLPPPCLPVGRVILELKASPSIKHSLSLWTNDRKSSKVVAALCYGSVLTTCKFFIFTLNQQLDGGIFDITRCSNRKISPNALKLVLEWMKQAEIILLSSQSIDHQPC